MIGGDFVEKKSYQCCFCDKQIISDVTELVVVTNWDKDKSSQQEQQMFCHMECLKKAVSSKFPLYIADLID
jgi:hypothetical protein